MKKQVYTRPLSNGKRDVSHGFLTTVREGWSYIVVMIT